jgi:hypothetical protein
MTIDEGDSCFKTVEGPRGRPLSIGFEPRRPHLGNSEYQNGNDA